MRGQGRERPFEGFERRRDAGHGIGGDIGAARGCQSFPVCHHAILYKTLVPDTLSPAYLFVYGSLRSEFDNPHARFLRETAESHGRATVQGSIYRIDEYPGYRSEPDGLVYGELWRMRDPESTLAQLDAYEGPAYLRAVIETSQSKAWIYIFTGNVEPDRRIETGDFFAF